MTIVLIGLMVVAFYFLMIRPQRKRQQKQQETLNALQPGTKVLLGSGVFGTILRIGDKQAVLELSPGNELTVLKQAIVRVAGPEDEDTEPVSDVVPEPAEPASTLDLKESEAAEGTPKQDEPGEQTWREYSIPQDDDAAASPANGTQPAKNDAAKNDAAKDSAGLDSAAEGSTAEPATEGDPAKGRAQGESPSTGGPGAAKE